LIRYEKETDLFQIGTPGQLLIDGHIKTVIPAEDAKTFAAANPVQADGRIVFDKKANEVRENTVVKRMIKASGIAVLVLGGAHDLSDNVPADVKLIVVTVNGYPGE
jgi:hypothetical protein